MKRAALLILPFALLSASTCAGQPNIIRNGDFEDEVLDGWQPRENVSIEATTEKSRSRKRATKLAWHDVTDMSWVAYDIRKLGTWKEMEFEFSTPFNTISSRGENGEQWFRLHFYVYPNQNCTVRPSGVIYINSLSLPYHRKRPICAA